VIKAASILLLAVAIAGCQRTASRQQTPKEAAGPVELLVTRDFGSKVLAEKSVTATGSPTVMDVLVKSAKVETAYGGGFINSINGLASGYTDSGGVKIDWFYSVNGIQASVGAADLTVRPGDKIWWDYHDWSSVSFVPAVVGSYPEPFVHGYEGRVLPVEVVYAEGFAHEAGAVRDALKRAGAKDVRFSSLRPDMPRPSDRSLLVLGSWKALSRLAWVADAAKDPAASGLHVKVAKGEVHMLDCRGTFSDSQRKAGAILATGESGKSAVAWLVTGTDDAAVRRAVDLLVKKPSSLAGKFGIVVDEDGNVIPVPRRAG